MKKTILISILFVVCLYATVRLAPLKGGWVDDALSAILSNRFKRSVQLHGVCIRQLRIIRFNSVQVFSSQEKEIARSGPGVFATNLFPYSSSHWSFEVSGIYLTGELGKKIAFLPEWIRKDLSRPDAIQSVKGVLMLDTSGFSVHITEMIFKGGRLKGHLFLRDRRLSSAQGILWVDKELSDRVLKNVYLKTMIKSNGPLRLRLSFRQNLITVHGPAGPLFQARWDVSSVNK